MVYFAYMIQSPCSIKIAFVLLLSIAIVDSGHLFGQSVQFQMFGHLEAGLEQDQGVNSSGFGMGEHDMFVTSQLTPMISFLSEIVVSPKADLGGFSSNIERALLKFNYSGNHSVIIGKMHTPVNYWNDTYHHGRLFFPTIDRPTSFSLVIPIHTLGLRLQGQNLGSLKFGYDLVVGNGLSSNDRGDGTLQKSFTGAVHFKPWEGSRIGVGYYRDIIINNELGAHGGHSGAHHHDPIYKGDVETQVFNASSWIENEKWEMLYELSLAVNAYPDSLEAPNSVTHLSYLYLGYKLNNETFFGIVDLVDVDADDLHLMPQQLSKFGIGWKHEFNPFIHIKTQLERYTALHKELIVAKPDKWEFKLQVAYGF
jgi:hypothetical protein